MERAGECGLIPFANTRQGCTTVLTGIDHRVKFAIIVTAYDERLTANLNSDKIIIFWNFTFVTS